MNSNSGKAVRLVAIFGHYDSRGGTMAVPVKSRSAREIRRAKRAYVQECGGEEYIYDMGEDFMHVAELWYPVGVDLPADLNYDGPESTTAVVRSRANETVLEVVMIPPSLTDDLDEKLKVYDAITPAAIHAASPDKPWPALDSPARRILDVIRADHYKFVMEIEAEKERRIEKLATIISDPQFVDWNDDAYGFVIVE